MRTPTLPTSTKTTPEPAPPPTLSPFPSAANAMTDAIEKLETVVQVINAFPTTGEAVQAAAHATASMINLALFLRDELPRKAIASFDAYSEPLEAEARTLTVSMPSYQSEPKIKEARERYIAAAAKSAAAAFGDRAYQLVNAAGDAMQTAENELAGAVARALGPTSLAAPIGIDLAVQIQQLREELKGCRPSLWLSLLRGYIERGERDSERTLALAMGPIADETLGMPAPKLAARYGGPNDAREVGAIRGEAQMFKAALDARKLELMPEHLTTIKRVLGYLQSVWDYLAGFNQSWLSSAEFSQRFLNPGAVPPKPGDIHPKWLERTGEAAIRAART